MRWTGIQSTIDLFKSTRFNVENAFNKGFKAFRGLKLSFSQENHNYRQHSYQDSSNFSANILSNNYSSDNVLYNNSFPDNVLSNSNLSINNISHNISLNPHRNEKKTVRNLRTTVSEYWKDALYNHWLILIQGLVLVILIMIISPWIGYDSNEDNYSYDNSYFDHRPELHLKLLRKNIEERSNLLSRLETYS